MPEPSPVPRTKIAIEPVVSFESRVTSGISIEVVKAFNGESGGGNEAGGILLGRRSGETTLVEDFEPVLCEHRSGPAYILSDDDLRGLEESVAWFRTPGAGDLEVLGFYRSQARPETLLDEGDHELMRRFFGGSGSLFLLLKPGRGEAITAELFVLAEGRLRPAGHPMLFPRDAIGPVRPPGGAGAKPVVSGQDARSVRPPLPPSRRRQVETQELEGRNWSWVLALVALTIAAAVLGYRSVSPPNAGTSPDAKAADVASTRTAPASNAVPARPPVTATPAAVEAARGGTGAQETEQAIRAALAQWEDAFRSGDPNLVAACYASQLDRYFQQRNSSNDEVRRAAAQSMARYGKPAILRITELTVTPVSEDRAIASFRKHWQTSGPRVFGGEEQERLIFIRAEDAWKIASEEETKVYWTQKPRG